MIRIGIIDDHSLLIEGMKRVFEEDSLIQVVMEANDGDEAIRQIQTTKPEVVLLDISMPGRDGQSVAAEILRRFPDCKVAILSMHQTPEYVLPLVDLGVSGFLLKNSTHQELRSAILLMAKGNQYFTEEIQEVIHKRNQAEKEDEFQITKREREILQLMYEGLSTADMADRLFISQHTVFKHRQNLLQKCNCKSASQLVNLAIRKGWVLIRTETD
ncbi:MAG: response regulator transcription factor [Bacteroidota bacterium]|nr:response regulator transcription factor [Bacteroidota bacterium]MDX5431194.1 response regulator transcription factor [Bacteroidota bacterium]MDX5469933.1 response regulator transcription factor [Bacteroidota bacterium]